MREVLRSFMSGYENSGSRYDSLGHDELEQEFHQAAIEAFEFWNKPYDSYTREQLIQIGFLEFVQATEYEWEGVDRIFPDTSTENAHRIGSDIGTYEKPIKLARKLFEEDFFETAKFTNFPEIYPDLQETDSSTLAPYMSP